MSKSDLDAELELEDGLRATFERAAASVPLAAGLADRATAGAQQAQRRTWLISGAAAAAVAVIATVGFSLQNGSQSPPQPAANGPAAAVSTAAKAPAATVETVTGSWRPVRLSGFTTLKAARPDDPVITFNADGTWTGSDGCNSLSGTYTIGQRGEFTSTSNGQRQVGCENVPHTAVLQSTERLESDKKNLTFYAGDEREVARYARTR
ncbi:META domain-containing protein [Kribbella sp. CA-293567]|uniref:META domain-containing protein n=1 Tax=Kribbella sp. CA-293567 TaxID=3002436 RepID=UPI0022DCF56B|nr:META domain-containing protein [Kribbella sp. CA-293567]WBQ06700.1 META domain-containing protein [Kribbella sp. CA-293567]